MNKYDRFLHILNLLRTRKNMNADALAKECNVTERTIYRDIIALSEMNIPIYYDMGYKLASHNFLPPLNFSLEEYQLLKLSLESSPLVQSELNFEVYKNLKAKIENCISDDIRREVKTTPEPTHIDIEISQDDNKSEDTYFILENAIKTSRRIKISYESISSGFSERIIDPYFIIFKGHAFYFVGFCHKHGEFRTFRLNRIRNIEQLDEIFIKKDGIEPETYFEGSWSVFKGESVKIEVIFKGAAKRVIESSKHHRDESIEIIDENTLKYSVTVNGIFEIQKWIAGFGIEAEVIAPPKLRENLKIIGQFYLDNYK